MTSPGKRRQRQAAEAAQIRPHTCPHCGSENVAVEDGKVGCADCKRWASATYSSCAHCAAERESANPFARWVWELQRALPDDCEHWLPRSIRCPFCGARFNGGYHETDCPVRRVA